MVGQESSMQKVTMYTTDYCPYCVRARSVLTKQGVSFEDIDVTHDPDKRSWLVENTGQRTVPQIFVGTESIGGCTDLEALVAKGGFMAKVNAA
jgi:glutaredoxin 3